MLNCSDCAIGLPAGDLAAALAGPCIAASPPQWIQACNGHRSNPWFLDALRTLLELCDGLASNSFGTHLGYAVHCQRRLHWLDAACNQTLTSLSAQQQDRETIEWNRRQELGRS